MCGLEAVQAENWESANAYADRLEKTGNADLASLLRAEVYYARKRPDQALAECNKIKDQGPIRVRGAALAGKCLLELGALAEADRVFSFVLSEDPNHVDAHRGLASIAYDLGQMNRAIAHLEQVIRLDPSDARPHRLLGEIMRLSDDNENAVAQYREALHIRNGLSDSALDEVRFEIAFGLVQLKRHGEALAVLDEAAAGGRPEPLYMVALRIEALRGVGKRREAIALADRAVAEHDEGPFYLVRGQLYLDEGNHAAAIPMLEKSVVISPHHYQSHFLLAQAYAGAGRTADAERSNAKAEDIRKQAELASNLAREAMARPWDAAVRLQLAKIYEGVGDSKSAAMWRKAAAMCQGRKN